MVETMGKGKKLDIKGERIAFFEQKGSLMGEKTVIYDGNNLATGSDLVGPAIIERYGDAVVIPPGFKTSIDKWGTIELKKD
jgi:N-methylhydantoinase A/oxoprolinase/acetone carboxylase beta subunit